MLKKIKLYMLVVAFALAFFVFAGTSVNAAYIVTSEDVETFFEGTAVTISGNKITLTDDVKVEDIAEWMVDGEYTIDLNGHVLQIPEVYISGFEEQSKVTLKIIDSSNNGVLESDWVDVYENCTLYLCNGKINNCISNSGNLTIEYAEAPSISQLGVAAINGGKFESLITWLGEDIKTTIKGGEFTGTTTEEQNFAIMIQSDNFVSEHAIDDLFADGLIADCESFKIEEPREGYSECYTAIWGPTVKPMNEIDSYSEVFKKITADGTWEVEALAPKGVLESEALLSSIVNKIVEPFGYSATAYAYCPGEKFTTDRALIYLNDGENTEEHVVKIKYLDPAKSEKAKVVNSVLNRMKYWNEDAHEISVSDAYILEDLHLINYLFANTSSSKVKGAQALNFAKDLIEATGGANISFEYDSRNGGGNPNALYTHSSGLAVVCVGQEPVASRIAALTASHVLYIPDTTADNDNAYVEAALKRIKDYMGEDVKIEITVGDRLDTLNEGTETYNYYNLFDDTKTGDNYFIVKINGKSYNFAIVKKEASKLVKPKYVGMNLGNNITITTDSTSVPLDTAISVQSVTNNSIKKALGTDVYAAYDITLHSAAKGAKITKIDDGKFVVSMPVPEHLKGIDSEKLTVYYINEKGEREEQKAEINKDGMAVFETTHFSTYVLAEKVPETIKNNPATADGILASVATLIVSIACAVVSVKCRKM